jgi:UDP-3-O-[3-hydroxymyristoyl] glucosamine N-acyltransferase
VLGGNLRVGRHCEVGSGVVFEGNNRIASHVIVPGDLRIAREARIQQLRLSGATMAPGTVICGNAFVSAGTRIGRGVTLEADAVVTAAALPDGVTIARRAFVNRCDVTGAVLQRGTRIGGDLYLAPGVQVGWNVRLHKGVKVNCACRIPDGVEFMPAAVVDWFQIAPRVVLPPGTRIAGNLCLKRGVVVGAGVRFGAGAVVEYDITIPNGAQLGQGTVIRQLDIAPDVSLPDQFTLYGDAVLGAGSSLGERVVLGKGVEIGAGVMLPPGVTLVDRARIRVLRIADDVVLPVGTRLGGDLVLRRGVRIGRDVELGATVDIGPHVTLPDGIVVACGATVRVLSIADDVLPDHGVCIEGDLCAGVGALVAPGVRFGAGVVLEADCSIGSGIVLRPGVIVCRHARLNRIDIAADVLLPPQTRIGGDLRIEAGVQVGRQVCFGRNVCIGPGVALPAGVHLADDATVNRLEVAADAVLGTGLTLCGDVVIGARVRIDDDVTLGAGVVVGAGVYLPKGVAVASNTTVSMLRLGADVRLPEEFGIAGDLCLEDRVVVGERVQFGAGVVVGAGVVIGDGALLGDNVVVCAGAVIGADACLAADAVVDAGTRVGNGEHVRGARPPDNAHFSCWQAYLSGDATPAEAPQPAVAAAMPPSSAPIDIPPANVRQPLRGTMTLPRPFT